MSKRKKSRSDSINIDTTLDGLKRTAQLLNDSADCSSGQKAQLLRNIRNARAESQDSKKAAARKVYPIVSHIRGPHGLGTLLTIVEQVDRAPDLEHRKGGKLMRAAAKAAQSAIEDVARLGITDNHPLAKLISRAIQAADLAWRAEVIENRHKHSGRHDGGKRSGENRTKRAKADSVKHSRLAAETFDLLQTEGKRGTLEEIAATSAIPLRRLQEIGARKIKMAANSLRAANHGKSRRKANT